jgi:hypothetical protein
VTNLPVRRRHDLDPVRVQDCVERKVADHVRSYEYQLTEAEKSVAAYKAADAQGRRLWTRPPELPSKALLDSWIKEEREYYALVRVIELPIWDAKRFLLVYGDTDDNTVTQGTGPFESFEKAADWFYKQGR